jgi:hypothetical protein
MAQLVEALCYKPEGRGFDWNFSLTLSFWPHCGPGFDSASNGNEYQKYFLRGKGGRCLGLTNHLHVSIVMNVGISASWNLQGLSRDSFTFS